MLVGSTGRYNLRDQKVSAFMDEDLAERLFLR